MKKLILISIVFFTMLNLNAQSFYSTFEVEDNTSKEEKTLTIMNKGYDAIVIDLFVKESYEWSFLQSVRIPGGSSVSYSIGKYENYFDYGYKKVGDNLSNSVSGFYSSTLSLY